MPSHESNTQSIDYKSDVLLTAPPRIWHYVNIITLAQLNCLWFLLSITNDTATYDMIGYQKIRGDVKCVWKPTKSWFTLTHHTNKSNRGTLNSPVVHGISPIREEKAVKDTSKSQVQYIVHWRVRSQFFHLLHYQSTMVLETEDKQHLKHRLLSYGNVTFIDHPQRGMVDNFGCVLFVYRSVCLSVCMSEDNFRKPWRRKFIFAHAVYLHALRVKFVYECHRVKVKVTGGKKVQSSYSTM